MIDALKQRIPDHARDLRINLGLITSSTALAPAQAWSIAVASAHTTRNAELVRSIEAASELDPAQLQAARGAASIMAMNNVYYRFLHMMGEPSEYQTMPARLRMQIIGNPGVPRLDFELACLAASAITGCASCVRSHEDAVRKGGGTREMVQDAVRIAAVIHGVATAISPA
jgi:alkyl hydroperoxide reductase subunit D